MSNNKGKLSIGVKILIGLWVLFLVGLISFFSIFT